MNKQNFDALPLSPQVQQVLAGMGFTEATEIQSRAIPALLEKDRVDFHGQAQTGTGKTLAFGLPLLHRIDANLKTTQSLVVAPTRELALQIMESIKPFAQSMGISTCVVCGGASMEDQMRSLRRGTHIVVGTPGRLNDHLKRKTLVLSSLKTLVLDEADIMLDMGFREEIDEILNFAPQEREIWLFSATVKPCIQTLMRQHMKDPVSVSVSRSHVGVSTTKQYYCTIPMSHRIEATCRFIEAAPEFYGFIFCQTKILTSEVAEQLVRRGYSVGALHGDMSQGQRNAVVRKFKERDYSIVVATDVAGRGIDIQGLTHVVNFSLPDDYESYVHRTGRTGRAGKEGTAITFLGRNQVREIKQIERKFNLKIEQIDVPSREKILEGCLLKAEAYLTELKTKEMSEQDKQTAGKLVSQFDAEQLSKMMAYLVHEKFVAPMLQDSKIDSQQNFSRGSEASDMPSVQELEFFIGTDDGLSDKDVLDHLIQNGSISQDIIVKIRMIKKRTFVQVAGEAAPDLLKVIKNTSLSGIKMSGRVVEAQPFERRGGFSRGGNGRMGGGRSERSDRGGERGGERSDRGSSRFGGGFGGGRSRFGGRDNAERSERSDRGERGGERGGDRGSSRFGGGFGGGRSRFGGRDNAERSDRSEQSDRGERFVRH